MVKHYKIIFGFGEADYIEITADELHKAYVCAMGNRKAVFSGGFVDNTSGSYIKRIAPDWHKAMGLTKGRKLDHYDYAEIKPIEKSYMETLRKGSYLAEVILTQGKEELLALPASEAYKQIPQLDSGYSNDVKFLADTFKP